MAKSVSKPVATSKPEKLAKKVTAKETEAPKKTKKAEPEKVEVKEEKIEVLQTKGKPETAEDKVEITIEKKLIALYSLQQIDSQIDRIRIIRGELPLEVQDLEDEIAGLETRIQNYQEESSGLEKSIADKKTAIKESHAMIKRYEEQQMNVRNNREYDSLSKEIEFQNLEIQLSEKRIREFEASLQAKKHRD